MFESLHKQDYGSLPSSTIEVCNDPQQIKIWLYTVRGSHEGNREVKHSHYPNPVWFHPQKTGRLEAGKQRMKVM